MLICIWIFKKPNWEGLFISFCWPVSRDQVIPASLSFLREEWGCGSGGSSRQRPLPPPRMWCTPPPSTRKSASSKAPKVSDEPFLLILGQSQDFPVEIASSRETSPVGSAASTWVNLDSDFSQQEVSGSNGADSKSADMQAKNRQLEKTVAALQAQLSSAPQATHPRSQHLTLWWSWSRTICPLRFWWRPSLFKREGPGRLQGCLSPHQTRFSSWTSMRTLFGPLRLAPLKCPILPPRPRGTSHPSGWGNTCPNEDHLLQTRRCVLYNLSS